MRLYRRKWRLRGGTIETTELGLQFSVKKSLDHKPAARSNDYTPPSPTTSTRQAPPSAPNRARTNPRHSASNGRVESSDVTAVWFSRRGGPMAACAVGRAKPGAR